MSLKKQFFITLYTENSMGILNRIVILFSRRRINIEALNIAPSEVPAIYRFTIIISETPETIRKLSLQLDKQVDVLKAFYHSESEVRWMEHALYKLEMTDKHASLPVELLSQYGIRRVDTGSDSYLLFETTGSAENTLAVLNQLEPYGIMEFTKSARIAVADKARSIHHKLLEFAAVHDSPLLSATIS